MRNYLIMVEGAYDIADDDWICEKTLETCRMLGKLNSELKKMIE